jgi:hypothetical protein
MSQKKHKKRRAEHVDRRSSAGRFSAKRAKAGVPELEKADVPPLRKGVQVNPEGEFAPPPVPVDPEVDPRLVEIAGMEPDIKVMIGIPTGGNPKWEFCHDLANLVGFSTLKLVSTGRINLSISWLAGCYVASNRNDLAVMALEQEATHILFLDDDMRFPPWALEHLLMRQQPIVGANYTTRKFPIRPVTLRNIDWTPTPECEPSDMVWTAPGATGMEEVDAVGGGVLLIDTDVFVKVKYPFFEQWYDSNRLRAVGEDVDFCKKARDAGYPVLIDHDLSHYVRHIGELEHQMDHAWAAWQEMTKHGFGHVRQPEDGDSGLAESE